MISYIILIALLFFLFTNRDKCVLLVAITYPTLFLFKVFYGWSVIDVISFAMFVLYLPSFRGSIQKTPVFWGLLAIFFSTLATQIVNYHGAQIMGHFPPYSEILLVLTLWQVCKKDLDSNFIFKTIFVYMLIIALYGMLESIIGTNPFIDYLRDTGAELASQRTDYIRNGLYRSQSLTIWTSTFGTLCCFMSLLLSKSMLAGWTKKSLFRWFIVLMCLAGVFITGSRTIILMTILAYVYLTQHLKNGKTIASLLIVGCVGVFFFGSYFEQVIGMFTHSDSVDGSSMELRELQYETTLFFWSFNPIWGNGINYVNLATELDSNLYGAESLLFKLLIDRGVIGVASFVILIASSILYLVKHHYLSMITIVAAYVFGKMNSLLPSLNEAYFLIFLFLLISLDGKYNDTEVSSY